MFSYREMKIKTSVRYHFIPIRMGQIKRPSIGGNAGQLEPLFIAGRHVIWHHQFGEHFGHF